MHAKHDSEARATLEQIGRREKNLRYEVRRNKRCNAYRKAHTNTQIGVETMFVARDEATAKLLKEPLMNCYALVRKNKYLMSPGYASWEQPTTQWI